MSAMQCARALFVVLALLAVLVLGQSVQAALITGVTASASSSIYSADHAVNGNGLSNGKHGTLAVGNMWRSIEHNAEQVGWIQFDLGGVYTLARMHVWNYNGHTPTGMKDADIKLSADGISWTSWSETFAQASGSSNYTGFDVSLKNISARYVRIESNSNHASGFFSTTSVGLSEVQFDGVSVPEPATVALLVLGGVFWVRHRKKIC